MDFEEYTKLKFYIIVCHPTQSADGSTKYVWLLSPCSQTLGIYYRKTVVLVHPWKEDITVITLSSYYPYFSVKWNKYIGRRPRFFAFVLDSSGLPLPPSAITVFSFPLVVGGHTDHSCWLAWKLCQTI
jgi:hypothetical protein